MLSVLVLRSGGINTHYGVLLMLDTKGPPPLIAHYEVKIDHLTESLQRIREKPGGGSEQVRTGCRMLWPSFRPEKSHPNFAEPIGSALCQHRAPDVWSRGRTRGAGGAAHHIYLASDPRSVQLCQNHSPLPLTLPVALRTAVMLT